MHVLHRLIISDTQSYFFSPPIRFHTISLLRVIKYSWNLYEKQLKVIRCLLMHRLILGGTLQADGQLSTARPLRAIMDSRLPTNCSFGMLLQ